MGEGSKNYDVTAHKKAANILSSNRYLTLATSGAEGSWASPLAYTIEPDLSLIFFSSLDSVHARNIVEDRRVSGAIFDSHQPSDTADGIQFRGTASTIMGADLHLIMERYFQLSFPDPEIRTKWQRPVKDFEEDSMQRFFRIEMEGLYKLDPESTAVDKRLALSISLLRQLIAPIFAKEQPCK